MRRTKFICMLTSSLLLLAGCSQLSPTIETLSTTEPETEAYVATTEPATTTEVETTTEQETTYVSIEITTPAPETTTVASGHMEANNQVYEKNNVCINYPVLVGMTNTEAQDWANKELYKDVMDLLKFYDVNEETDTFTLDYEVSTLYRGEFSLVYEGEFKKADSGMIVKVKAAEDLDLAKMSHLKLSDRLAVSKVLKCIRGDEKTEPEFEIIYSSVAEDTLRSYLSQQSDEFFENMVANSDFGKGQKLSGYFSYNHMNNVAIIIPMPHVMGDYAVISIKQQTK